MAMILNITRSYKLNHPVIFRKLFEIRVRSIKFIEICLKLPYDKK